MLTKPAIQAGFCCVNGWHYEELPIVGDFLSSYTRV